MRAFVVGNAVLDETYALESPPVPGASVLARALGADLGGKGANQAVVLARAGVAVTLAAPVGRDARGDAVRARLGAEGLAAGLVAVDAATDASVILTGGGGENLVVTTHAAADALSPGAAAAALAGAAPGDLLVMQGNLSEAATRAALAAARARGLRTALNPSPLRPWFAGLWGLLDAVFVNEGEAAALGGAAALLGAGAGQVVVTLGAQGARLIARGAEAAVPAAAAAVVDPTGAGDAFLGTALASAGLRGGALDARALRHGAAAAAVVVGRAGTLAAFPTRPEMAAILATP